MEMHLNFKISEDEADMTGISLDVLPKMIVAVLFKVGEHESDFLN